MLVVDDDPRAVRAFEREWAPGGQGWHVEVATARAEAERVAGGTALDATVVVHRLPDLDGFLLSSRLREIQPGAVRVIVCGHSDRSRVLAAGADVHLAFPRRARPPHVARHLLAVFEAREGSGLARDSWTALLALDALPTAAARRQDVSSLLRVRPFPRLVVIERLERDPGLAAQVLRAVNAPHFGVNRPVGDLPTAVALLGPWATGEIVTAVERAARQAPRLSLVDEVACERATARAQLARKAMLRAGADSLAAERAYAKALLAEAPWLLAQALPTGASAAESHRAARVLFTLWGIPQDSVTGSVLSLESGVGSVGLPGSSRLVTHNS